MSVYFNGKKVSIASTTKIYGGKYNVTAEDKEDGTQKIIINTTPTNPAIVPTGTIDITENERVDVTKYAFANVNVSGGGVELPAFMSAKNFTFNGTACTGYVGDNTLPEIIIPKSYSTITSIETVVGAKVLDKENLSMLIYDFQSITFSDGGPNTQTYTSTSQLQNLSTDFPNDCYLVSMQSSSPFSFDFLQMASDMQVLQFPIAINGQRFSDGMTAFDYIRQDNITNVNFGGDVEVISYIDGDDYQVTEILGYNSNYVFEDYSGRVILLNNIQQIGEFAFDSSGIESIEIPDSVTTISEWAFRSCSRLKSVIIPNTAQITGSQTFLYCRAIKSVSYSNTDETTYNFENGVLTINSNTDDPKWQNLNPLVLDLKFGIGITKIPDHAFEYCHNLKKVNIPEGVTTLGEYCFYLADGIEEVTLPSTITEISDKAFYLASGIKTFKILATTPPIIDTRTFYKTSIDYFYVPAGTLSAYQSATNWSNFADKFEELPS